MNNRIAWRIALFAAIVAVIAFVFIHYDLCVFFTNRQKAIEFLKSYGPFSIPVFILLQILQVIAAPVPGEVTGLIGGYLYGTFQGTLYSTVGLTLGSLLAFTLSKTFGLRIVEKVVRPEIVRKYDHFMEHKGVVVSFVLFLIPGFPKDALCYIMGLSHMTTWTFLVISTLGRLFGTILLSVEGSCIRSQNYIGFTVLLAISGIIILAAYVNREKLLMHLHRRHPHRDQRK